MWSDQAMRMPAFAGAKGARVIPLRAGISAQVPVEPSRVQLAPPKARTVTSAVRSRCPSGVSNRNWFSSQPVHSHLVRNRAPLSRSRASHARNKGEAFIATGNTRPVEPVKTSWPKARAQSWTAAPSKSLRMQFNQGAASAKAARNGSNDSSLVRFSPDLPESC